MGSSSIQSNNIGGAFVKKSGDTVDGALTLAGGVDGNIVLNTANATVDGIDPSADAAALDTDEAALATHEADNTAHGLTGHVGTPGAHHNHNATILTNSAAQSISNGVETAVTFDTEGLDDAGWHESVTNPSRVTVDANGIYLVTFNARFVTGSGVGSFRIHVNGTGVSGGPGFNLTSSVSGAGVGLAQLLNLSANDYVEARVYQESGGALNLNDAKLQVIRLEA